MNFFYKYALNLKLLYFLVNFQYFTFYNFRGNLADSVFGISKKSFGMWFGVALLFCFFTNSFVATLNDKFERPKLLICILLIMSCLSFELFYFIPKDSQVLFWTVMFMYCLFSTGMPALLDKFTIEYLARSDYLSSRSYGNHRLFGTLGYLAVNLIVEGYIRPKGQFNFEPLKIFMIVVTIPAILIVCYVVKGYESRQSAQEIENSWKELLLNKEYMFFIFIIFLNGLTRTSMTMFVNLYYHQVLKLKSYKSIFGISGISDIKDGKGFGNIMKGIILAPVLYLNKKPMATAAMSGVLLEILILFYSKRIISRFGLYWPLLMAQIAQITRFFGYYILPYDNKNVFLYACLLETFKGINFGLTHSSAVHIANKLCPPHLKSTSQMIYTGTFQGLSSFFAGQIFGNLFSSEEVAKKNSTAENSKEFGLFFQVNMGISLLCCVMFVIKYGFFDGILTFGSGPEEISEKKKEFISEVNQKNGKDADGNLEDSEKRTQKDIEKGIKAD